MNIQTEMPRYRCHKEVHAIKIKEISFDSDMAKETGRETNGTAVIMPEEPELPSFIVDADFVAKHKPQSGGYYVVYADGYKSFSPAQAFEEGYSLIK